MQNSSFFIFLFIFCPVGIKEIGFPAHHPLRRTAFQWKINHSCFFQFVFFHTHRSPRTPRIFRQTLPPETISVCHTRPPFHALTLSHLTPYGFYCFLSHKYPFHFTTWTSLSITPVRRWNSTFTRAVLAPSSSVLLTSITQSDSWAIRDESLRSK